MVAAPIKTDPTFKGIFMPVFTTLRRSLAGAAFLAIVLSAPAMAQEPVVLATVNGTEITNADVNFAKEALGEALQQMPADQQDAFVINMLIESRLLADAGAKEGIAETPEYKRQMEWLEAQALREGYVQKRTASMVSDADVQAKYDEAKAQVSGAREIKASHILLKTKEEAEAVIAELDQGADFAELAKSKSTGPSGPRGGDLGYFGPGRMVPEFETAANALEKGTYTKQPVMTQFGWHVIRKDDEREQAFPAFDQVKDRIKVSLQAEKLQGIIKELRDAAKIEIKGQ
jgi:peptidyl-prolyl cis-trans isomerase C